MFRNNSNTTKHNIDIDEFEELSMLNEFFNNASPLITFDPIGPTNQGFSESIITSSQESQKNNNLLAGSYEKNLDSFLEFTPNILTNHTSNSANVSMPIVATKKRKTDQFECVDFFFKEKIKVSSGAKITHRNRRHYTSVNDQEVEVFTASALSKKRLKLPGGANVTPEHNPRQDGKKYFATLDGQEVEVFTAGALSQKRLKFAGGANVTLRHASRNLSANPSTFFSGSGRNNLSNDNALNHTNNHGSDGTYSHLKWN